MRGSKCARGLEWRYESASPTGLGRCLQCLRPRRKPSLGAGLASLELGLSLQANTNPSGGTRVHAGYAGTALRRGRSEFSGNDTLVGKGSPSEVAEALT